MLANVPGEIEVVEREVRRAEDSSRPALEIRGNAKPDRPDGVAEHRVHGVVERLEHGLLGGSRTVLLVTQVDDSLPIDDSGADLRPAHVDSDHEGAPTAAGYHSARMAEGDKPYRRYRGGRVKGRVPLERRKQPAAQPGDDRQTTRGRRRWGRWIVLAAVGLLVLTVVWGVLGYLSFSSGVDEANERLPRRAAGQLADLDGSLFSKPATILVIGTDGGKHPAGATRAAPTRSCCCAPIPASIACHTCRSPAISASTSRATAQGR